MTISEEDYDAFLDEFIDAAQATDMPLGDLLEDWNVRCPEYFRERFLGEAAVTLALKQFGPKM